MLESEIWYSTFEYCIFISNDNTNVIEFWTK